MTPVATYRLQLRQGVDFDAAAGRAPYIAGLGVSHLYLSPIFTAGRGSTHGYDVTDPSEIDPVLGGRDRYNRLVEAARAAGLGVILDIVPNHTAFSVENPWLRDVLRQGPRSPFAPRFDIDWSKGRLVLPWLGAPFEERLAAGALRLSETSEGPVMSDGDLRVPVAPGSLPAPAAWADADALRETHEKQAWRLTHWEFERDGVSHRRFFNVTGLIGMRVEEPEVFAATHALIVDLVRNGLAHGVRVDHVDGLADPAGYLRRLRAAVGDATPIWVEKILTGDEPMPDWPIQGSTGYEACQAITRLLTDADGLSRLDAAWRRATGRDDDFHETLRSAKGEVMRQELAAELHALIGLARAAADAPPGFEVGDEALREAILALLTAFPRYRTYFTDAADNAEDRALMERVATSAAEDLRTDAAVRFVASLVADPQTDEARAFRVRWQQMTGALLAKAHEDTAGFRFNRYLAANEVGAEPDEATITPEAFTAWMRARVPTALTLTSSHDTKRSEDARARLIAISHDPESFVALGRDAPPSEDVDPNLRWYAVQALLAIWEPGGEDIVERLATHVEKAMREAKETTNWSHPAPEVEAAAMAWSRSLAERWLAAPPPQIEALVRRGEALSLAQAALKLLMPGVPDIYQGAEGAVLHLTDPDNRRPVDWSALEALVARSGFAGRKARLTRALLALRAQDGAFFVEAAARVERDGASLGLIGSTGTKTLTMLAALDGSPVGAPRSGARLWPEDAKDADACIAIDSDARSDGTFRGGSR